MKKKIKSAILSGLSGTLAMTLFDHSLSPRRGKVIKVLGTMLTTFTNEKPKATAGSNTIGTLVHYSVGVLFALSYLILWKYKIGKPDFKNALILGSISGIIGISVWSLYFKIHSNPPSINLPHFLLLKQPGHIIFAIVEVESFNLFSKIKL